MLEADTGAGVACLFGNYAGDNMNVKMAIQAPDAAFAPPTFHMK
jgi:dihydroxyacetone kinase